MNTDPLLVGGGVLVSDDQTLLCVQGDRLCASAPAAIAGMIEVRGVGLLTVPHNDQVRVGLVVEMIPLDKIERLPEPDRAEYLGIAVPLLQLDPFMASTPAKIRYYLRGAA